jgi:hypothetical protein
MMKRLLTTALVGLAGAALSLSTANAQSTVSTTAGDLILGFYATSGSGAAFDVEVNLGSVNNFLSATPGETFSLTGANALAEADLVATYGANWATDPDLFWGVITTNQASSTAITGVPLYSTFVTDPESTPGTLNPPWINGTRFAQEVPSGLIESVILGMNQGTSTTNSTETEIIPTSIGDSYYAADFHVANTSLDAYTPTIDNAVTNVDASGNSISDFYELTSTNPETPGTVIGQFKLNSDFGFEYVAAVPEPSSIGLAGVGFLSLIGFVALRRRSIAA